MHENLIFGIFPLHTLEVIGLIIAIIAIWQATKHAKELKRQTQGFQKVVESISTKYINNYPNYIKEITELISTAEKDILIVTADITKGVVASHTDWIKYIQSLSNKLETQNVRLKILTYDRSRRSEHQNERILDWEKFQKNNEQKITQFSKYRKYSDPISKVDIFLKELEALNNEITNFTLKHGEFEETNTPLTLYFWIVDDKEAIFVIPSINTDDNEVAFRTKDPRMILALKNIGSNFNNLKVNKKIRPLYSTVFFDKDAIKQSAVDFLNESNEVYTLGTIGLLTKESSDPYVLSTKQYFSSGNKKYLRIANFIPQLSSDEEFEEIKENVSFFLGILKSKSSQLELYHNPNLAKGLNDFHFRCSDSKVVIRLGGQMTNNKSAIEITDSDLRQNFLIYYHLLKSSLDTKRLEAKHLEKLESLLNSGNKHETSILVNEYLSNLSVRESFDSSLHLKEVILPIHSFKSFTEIEIFEMYRIFNRFGFVILELYKNEHIDQNASDLDILSLNKYFGETVFHDRSDPKTGVVLIEPTNIKNTIYLGQTNLEHPLHTDSVYEPNPPKVVAMLCVQNSETGGESLLVSSKQVFDNLQTEFNQGIAPLSTHNAIHVERGNKKIDRPVFNKNINGTMTMSYRHDKITKIELHDDELTKKAFHALDKIIHNNQNVLTFKLEKNQILVFDNTAILHGRKSFEGMRCIKRLSFDGNSRYSKNLFLGFNSK